MELRRYLTILRRRVLLIIVTTLIAGAVGWTLTNRTSSYVAQSRVYIGASRFATNDTDVNVSNDRTNGLDRLLITYAVMIDSIPIANGAIQRTGLAMSAPGVVARAASFPIPGTNLLLIQVTDSNPQIAQTLANGLADTFVDQVSNFETTSLVEGGPPAIPAVVFDRAQLPTVPKTPSAAKNAILAAVFGMLFAAAVVLLVEYLDVTVKSADDAERRLELAVLGVIPLGRAPVESPVVLRRQYPPPDAEPDMDFDDHDPFEPRLVRGA